MRRRYFDIGGRQLHVYETRGDEDRAPSLLCLHPVPYSGLFFETFSEHLPRYSLLCPDYPGYGASDPSPAEPTIEAWADDLLAVLDAWRPDDPVNVLGFHTGCLVGAEMARRVPSRIARLVLADVPYFDREGRRLLRLKTAAPPDFEHGLESLAAAWNTNVESRRGRVPLYRCLALLAEQLRGGTRAHEGFTAAFSYDAETAFPAVTRPCLVVATDSSLRDPSIRAAQALPRATLRELPEVGPPAFETGAAAMAAACEDYLGPEPPGEPACVPDPE